MSPFLAGAAQDDDGVQSSRDVEDTDAEEDEQRHDEGELDKGYALVSARQFAHGLPAVMTGNLASARIATGFTLNAASAIEAVISEKL